MCMQIHHLALTYCYLSQSQRTRTKSGLTATAGSACNLWHANEPLWPHGQPSPSHIIMYGTLLHSITDCSQMWYTHGHTHTHTHTHTQTLQKQTKINVTETKKEKLKEEHWWKIYLQNKTKQQEATWLALVGIWILKCA
jgi:hypothetical protein